MKNCINKNHPDVLKMAEELNVLPAVLSAKIMIWQTKNDIIDRFPTIDELISFNKINIKPGVEELFNSNPELANEVYEALGIKQGFDTKGISIKFNDGDWNIIRLNDKRIGQFKFVDNGEKDILSLSIQINEDYQNKGYGQIVHIMAADLAKKEYNKNLYSDYQNSEQEIQLLKSLVKKGYAEQTGNIGTESKEFPGTFNTTERAFRIKTSDEIKTITPQQKQQAQQQYSQYLDTIFPDSKVKDIVYHGTNRKFEQFNKEFLASRDAYKNASSLGFYFTTSEKLAEKYLPKIDTDPFGLGEKIIDVKNAVIVKAVLDIKNPVEISEEAFGNIQSDIKKQDFSKESDSLSVDGYVFSIFEPEQIHILGSKQDIEGFKKFVNENTTSITFSKEVDFTDVVDNSQEDIFKQPKVEHSIVENENNNKKLLFGENEKTILPASEVLTNLIQSDVFDKIKEADFFLEKTFNLLYKSGASLKLIDKTHFFYNKFDNKTVMLYDSVTNDIYVTESSLNNFSQYDIVSSFIHEVVHSTTVKAYFNPKTFEEKEFKKLIDKSFEQYKYLSTKRDSEGNLMYGFTNQAEFIAEIYSNPEFRKEIQKIEKNWLSQFIDAVRRLFGMSKTIMNQELINSVVLFNKVEQFAEKDMSKWKGTLVKDPRYERFGTTLANKVEKPSNETFDDKLTNLLNRQLNNVEQMTRMALAANKKYGNKNQAFLTKIETLKDSLKAAQLYDKLEGINNYTDFMVEQAEVIFKDLQNNINKLENLETIEKYESYLGASDLLKPIRDTLNDVKTKSLSEEDQEFIQTILNKVINISGKHDDIISKFKNYKINGVRKELRSSYYVEKVVQDFRNELSKDYPKNSNLSKNEWLNQEVLNRQAELDERIDKELNEVIDGISPDISAWDKWIYSTLNTKSRLIQIVQKIISKMKSKIDELVRNNDFKLKKLNDDLITEKGSYNVSNLLETDSNGETFLKGKYSIEFRNKYINEYSKYLDELNTVTARLNKEGKSLLNNVELEEIRKKLTKWITDNTITVKGQKLPNDKYLNNFKLSKAEQAIYDEYISLAKNSEKVFGKSGSLVSRSMGINYYSLPYKTISSLERVMTNKLNVVDTLKQKKSEFLDWKIDDIDQYEKMYDSTGTQIFNIPVMFRNNLDKKSKEYKQAIKEQSKDLLTLMRLEYFNQTNFKIKSENEMLLNTMVDISKDKDYVKTQLGTNNLISNLFGVQTKYVTFKGVESNEYKRLQSIIQQSLYNIFKEEGIKMGGKDSNKIVQSVNKHTSFLGMSLNYFNAPVNVLNGEFQIFLQRIAKDIDKGNLKAAHIEYAKDLPNIVADTGRPVKLSKINQLNNIMDIFGGLTHDQQDFIKNTILKSVTDPQMLQILQNGGEHLVQSVLNIALMKTIKVMNNKGQYVNKEGKVVSEKDAASLYDMVQQDKDTKQVIINNSKFEYTSLSTVTKWEEGGFENVRLYVKKKIFDTMGEYDKNFQNEIQKHWWGQLLLMYKKFLIPLGLTRYRGGISSVLKSKDQLTEEDKHWNEALQQYEEGYYITTARLVLGGMFNNGISGALNNLKYSILKSKWEELSDYEKANVRKGITELGFLVLMNMIILPLLMGMAAGDDDDSLWYLAMIGRRLEQELSQYLQIEDAYKITKNPIASLNMIEDFINVSKFTLSPMSWFSETKEGNSRFLKAVEKITIPSAWREDRTSKNIVRYMNREIIVPYEESTFYQMINQ